MSYVYNIKIKFFYLVTESDVYKKMIEMENLAETRLKAISVLEAQKFDLVQGMNFFQSFYYHHHLSFKSRLRFKSPF